MRKARLKAPPNAKVAFFHCISRVVDRDFRLGDEEKEKFVELMREYERFCGVQVVTYCIMSNHFHVLIRVPGPLELTDGQLVERLEGLYGSKGALTQLAREAMRERGKIDGDIRRKLVERMGDVSAFMGELKQRFSRWYNRRHERLGTLWAERFKSVVVEDQPGCLEAVAAYIDLNPVRAGLVEDPKDYRFCGYAAAMAGNALARQGLMSFLHQPSWSRAPRRTGYGYLWGEEWSIRAGRRCWTRRRSKK